MPPKRLPPKPVIDQPTPKTVHLSPSVQIAGEEKLLELRRSESPISWSALVEVALLELFKRADLPGIVKRYGVGLRRS